FRPKKPPKPCCSGVGAGFPEYRFQSRHLFFGHIIEKKTDRMIDVVLFVALRGPASFTGEDVVVFHSHSGPAALRTILKLVLAEGIVLAGPGEFTRRAFVNGRIDLTQAEAVMDMISARSETALEVAAAHVAGRLQTEIAALRSDLLDVMTAVEAAIDFPDDVGPEIDVHFLTARLNEIIAKIDRLIEIGEHGKWAREGLKIVIIGGPNVGKSSLMNCLVDRERSIVSDIPGTTRDFLEDTFVAGGIPILLVDTAGIRVAEDPLETLGIQKTWQMVQDADLILFVVDVGRPLSPQDREIFARLSGKPLLLILNKMDLPESLRSFELPEDWRSLPYIGVSALYYQGIPELKSLISETATGGDMKMTDWIVPNLRHQQCLKSTLREITLAREGFARQLPFELIAMNLTAAMHALQEITGENVRVDILDQIFSRFCIGK
ncbi:MAG: tRNA uridine-5-carboxymethylaminomethyl(34) synthesis GTPase MnmE, partial [Desulfococcus multivorans]|nr:tRNA uridine-5-carboxymethylaminomethyl(34) synthesis GTPase MnmE [Desulfococcus multivorans]